MLSLVNVAEKLMGDKFRKKTFDNARALINDPNAKYMKYANSLLDEVAPNVIKVHALNSDIRPVFTDIQRPLSFIKKVRLIF